MTKDLVNHPACRTKKCSACEAEMPLTEFSQDLRTKDQVGAKCRICARKVTEAFYAKYPEKEAERRIRNAAHSSRWYRDNRPSQVERMKWNTLLRKYSLTKEKYEELLSRQGGKCAICESHDPGRKDHHFAVDHNHKTKAIRGLLCQRCNCAVGFMKDNPELLRKAAEYVEAR